MANRQCFYFYVSTWDYPPDGPIKLGNVITSVKRPERALHCVPPPTDSDVFSTKKSNVLYTAEKLRGGKFSILTKFLSVLGFGVDISAEVTTSLRSPSINLKNYLAKHSSDMEVFSFKTIETTQFIPTLSYLQKCIENEHARRFLHMSRYRKPLYIVTGIKVVTGAQANTFKSRAVGASFASEADGTVLSGGTVPIGGGPGIEGKAQNKTTVQWEACGDFVFAFRASRVLVGKVEEQVASEEEYRKGAMLGHEEEEVQGPELSVLKIEDPDVEAEGFDVEDLTEDGDAVPCSIPRKFDDDWQWS